ncbi:hypothetical protein BDV95DRAFT_566806 [Massariosphaeria phaeospora]|uniref:Gamma interferon inducible lysosomal thiol reductase-domain-containing protein n=1 Tax=Massariosphaeria phaeospora TaxID=100035 RepID=A0A7C8ID92_9PLEO|nr:hypothetical protein BDV95DRAFT_566806 [Massariosphaeria phaeospora]
MDTKAPLLPNTEARMPRRPISKRFSRFHAAAFTIILGLFWLARTWDCHHDHQHEGGDDGWATKVPLEVHIMSKCPDARDCLEMLVVPVMANISDKVDFRLSFIGETTDEDDGVQCMHGQTECLGDILELCAASEYPDPKLYLGFTMCMEQNYEQIPKRTLIEDCALEHGLEFDKLNDCMSKEDGAYGMGLLRDSVQRSADLNVSTSCTVRLNDEIRCLYDNGEFVDCSSGSKPKDLIRDIQKLYDEAKGWSE